MAGLFMKFLNNIRKFLNSQFHKRFFANKALEYYNRMGEGSLLQIKYAKKNKK
jgi:hypothetical protein